ncbi:unnamed protein product [Schistocephalus solidus]|uniref:G_PROTEIN_RECEP_F1_2 domain-containing protein n=1 Tax=Schistocephalus solidus TaxID=70667 RepID=A0A183SQB8_SCHSO|nr:unnamed protein product [Schistocephalus solidus]
MDMHPHPPTDNTSKPVTPTSDGLVKPLAPRVSFLQDGCINTDNSTTGKKIISKTYKSLLFASILLPFIALWLIIFAAFAPDWELVNLRVDRFLQLLCPGGGFNGTVLTLSTGINSSRLILRQLLLVDGRQVGGGGLAEGIRLCRGLERSADHRKRGLDFTLSDIVGIRIGRESVEGAVVVDKDTWEVYNIQAGVFRACNVVNGKCQYRLGLITGLHACFDFKPFGQRPGY